VAPPRELALDRVMGRLGRGRIDSHVAGLRVAVHNAKDGIGAVVMRVAVNSIA
jgi:hypothetical protein